MVVLSAADLRFFAEHGWVVAKGVIGAAQCAKAAQEVWDFAQLSASDEESWYEDDGETLRPVALGEGGWYHGEAEWENRTDPRVHEAFSELWGTETLWTSHDGGGLNLPVREPALKNSDREELHWDCDLRLWSLAEAKAARPIVGGVQGVLYLVDTPPENGAFVCLPGFHRQLDSWLDTLSEGTDNLCAAMNDEFQGDYLRVGVFFIYRCVWDHFVSIFV